MIKKYAISNFKGISKKIEISLEAEAKRKSEDQIVKMGNSHLLLVSALMGINGSGKTTLLDSFYFYNLVKDGFISKIITNKVEKEKTTSQNAWEEYISIIFCNEKKPITIMVEFVDNKNTIKHDILIQKNGSIFEKIIFNDEIIENKTTIYDFKSKILDIPFKEVRLINWDNDDEAETANNNIIKLGKKHLFWNKEFLVNWLRIADNKIVDVTYGKDIVQAITLEFENSEKTIPFFWASSGTVKWFNVGVKIFDALFERQSFFTIDELEKSLHISLVDFIIRLFSDPKINKKKSQLLFTTHSPAIIGDYFRKDGINYLESMNLINLGKDLKIRKDVVFSKNYIDQNLGAHPKASTKFEFLKFLEEMNDK